MKKIGYMPLNGGIMGQATGPQKDRLQLVHNRSFWFLANWATGNWTDHNWLQLATTVQLQSVVVQSSCQSLHQLPTGLQNTRQWSVWLYMVHVRTNYYICITLQLFYVVCSTLPLAEQPMWSAKASDGALSSLRDIIEYKPELCPKLIKRIWPRLFVDMSAGFLEPSM